VNPVRSSLFVPSLKLVALALLAPAVAAAAPDAAGRDVAARVRADEASYHASVTPAFARQTGLACNVCHTHYPELTATGRGFKLNGYVMRRADSLQGMNAQGGQNMLLNLVTPLSFMLQTSFTATQKVQPGTQNGTIFFPDQLSVFTGGEITPHVGGFLQLTFDPQSGAFGVDNADLRWADNTTLFGANTVLGFSLNNNPTVQDLWNSTPAWGFPYASSAAAPTPSAHAVIDGGLGGQVAGMTAYAMWNNRIYAEFGGYRAAPLGINRPIALDSTSVGLVSGFAPYWRVNLPFDIGSSYLSVGTYGMRTQTYTGPGNPLNTFTDVAADATLLVPSGSNSFSVDATYIHESQNRPLGSQNVNNTLSTFRLDAMFHVGHKYAFTLMPFVTTGTRDTLVYTPSADAADLNGSATGKPDASGLIAEVDYMPWQNLRLQLQYVAYSKFNGASSNYNGFGRNASDNNTLYIMTWLLF
jgi:hypothetical protein